MTKTLPKMSRSWLFFSSCILLLAVSHEQHLDGPGKVICDDGKYHVDEDIGDKNRWTCTKDRLVVTEYDLPAGVEECTAPQMGHGSVCMSETIEYNEAIPSSGSYRPLPPAYGEYLYLPPQRWLHALKFGAIAFLYHPCAPHEQIAALREIAWTCLRKYVMTPYPSLSVDKPLAMVSWGCVYSMTWVHKPSARLWVQTHALNTSDSQVVTDGRYNYGLKDKATVVSTLDDSVICPENQIASIADPPTGNTSHATSENTQLPNTADHVTTDSKVEEDTTQPPSPPCSQSTNSSNDDGSKSCDNGITIILFIHTHPILTGVTMAMILVAVVTLGLCLWACYTGRCGRGRRRSSGRYKSVSHFFPVGAGGEVHITIPELGVPKAMSSEREKLLVESDEDEL